MYGNDGVGASGGVGCAAKNRAYEVVGLVDRPAERSRCNALRTGPTDPCSVLRLNVQHSEAATSVTLRWMSVTGRMYAIEFVPTLANDGGWKPLLENIRGSGAEIEWRIPTLEAAMRLNRLGVARD
jgi:hypothetical protein